MTRTERQEIVVNKWIANKCIGTCVAATGVGKTRIGLMSIKRFLDKNPGRSVMIIVPTQELKNQWEKQLEEWGFFMIVEVYIINTVIKNKYKVDLLILDEIHRLGAPFFLKVFDVVNYKLCLGLTATLERLDGHHKIIEKFIPVIDNISLQEALANSWLAPYKEYKVLIDVDLTEYRKFDKEFKEHFAFFDFNFDVAMKCATNWKIRNNFIQTHCVLNDKKEYTTQVMYHAMGFVRSLKNRKEFIYKHPKKIEITNIILEHRIDKKAITFSPTIDIAEKIKYGYILHSKQTKKKRAIAMEEFSNLETGVINSSKALCEGVDIAGLNLGIILTGDSSKLTKTQKTGRIIRFSPNKEAELFTLVLNNTVDDEWFKRSNTNTDYIVINETELMNVLNNKPYSELKEKTTNLMFRF